MSMMELAHLLPQHGQAGAHLHVIYPINAAEYHRHMWQHQPLDAGIQGTILRSRRLEVSCGGQPFIDLLIDEMPVCSVEDHIGNQYRSHIDS